MTRPERMHAEDAVRVAARVRRSALPVGLHRFGACGIVMFAIVGLAGCQATSEPAETVFRGGVVHTMDPNRPVAQAVAVRSGGIVYVGDDRGARPFIGDETEVIELDGRMLLPGFHDTHVHPISGGIELGECDLNAAASRDDVVRLVAACAARAGDAPWVRGGGFQLPLFPNGAPSRELLDSLVPDRPAYLTSADGHSAWVNSRALEIGGVTARTGDPPPDGVIVRAAGGRPQGTLRESAMALVGRHLPPRTEEEVLDGLRRGLEMAASVGITTLHEASANESFVRAYATAVERNLLTARVIVSLRVDTDRGTDQVAELVALRERYGSRLVRPTAAKIFLDGVIEGQTAALLADYTDRPGWRGELNLAPDAMNQMVAALDDAGFKVHVHAIGDRAIRVAFDAFEAQFERDGGEGPRHLMAHIQLFEPTDIPRFAALGVVASFQPLWFYADTYITELTEPRLGPERSRWLYPAKSVAETGAIVAAGSDWSVSSMDPLRAIEVAVTRRPPGAEAGPAWIEQERMDLADMLSAYTRAGAIAGDMLMETGTVTVGKRADLVVLDSDLFSIAPERIAAAKVDLTMFEGRIVHRR